MLLPCCRHTVADADMPLVACCCLRAMLLRYAMPLTCRAITLSAKNMMFSSDADDIFAIDTVYVYAA